MEINLDKFNLPKIYMRQGKACFLDPVRKKLIPRTPEEEVRQKVIQLLIMEMKVPQEMIDVEVPMSYYNPKARGRADIIVNAINDKQERIPVLIVETKATGKPLLDDYFNQIHKYEEILQTNNLIVTNGVEFVIQSWDSMEETFKEISVLPTYLELLNKDVQFIEYTPFLYHKREYSTYESVEVLNFYRNHFGKKAKSDIWKLIINMNELLWDDTDKIKAHTFSGLRVVRDIGVRYTSFGNAAGFDWTADYRSMIIEDSQKNNQIVSLAILHGYLVVAIDDYKKSHNSLQYQIQDFVQEIDKDLYQFDHNGRLALSNKGPMKWNEVIQFVKDIDQSLVNQKGRIDLGILDNRKEFSWDQPDVREFFGRIIKYSLYRDEFRRHKLNQL
ncbi:type I restriction enzyme HsdR N-terminal domain-containing protein [Brevibacillus centrosporus]|uniref:type I restriction enzyme HsdR N-terminal domain-containing protein n=1 Tax=Brevibacillus centrosporus TaxID=54910 RepID=UPI00398731B6